MDALLVSSAFAVLVVAQFTAVIAAVEGKQRNGQLWRRALSSRFAG
jgi:hypothetical protein